MASLLRSARYFGGKSSVLTPSHVCWRVGIYVNSLGIELSQSRRESPVSGDLARDAPVQSAERRPDATSDGDPLPKNRTRSMRTDTQRPGVEG